MSEIKLSPRELLLIATELGAKEFLGVPDAFFGMEASEIKQEIVRLKASLEQKGYGESDFDGGFALNEEIMAVVETCTNCDTFIVVDAKKGDEAQQRELYYTLGDWIVRLQDEGDTVTLTKLEDETALLSGIKHKLQLKNGAEGGAPGAVTVPSALLLSLQAEAAGGIEPLVELGADERAAQAVCDGLRGRANFYSVIVTVINGAERGVRSVILLDTSQGLYKMSPMGGLEDAGVAFEPVTLDAAERELESAVSAAIIPYSEGYPASVEDMAEIYELDESVSAASEDFA